MVGEVFQQAFRNRWIDPTAEFAIPRPLPPEARSAPLTETLTDVIGKFWRSLQGN